jgi:glycosyltransferase involved in cell wall biosynthesis
MTNIHIYPGLFTNNSSRIIKGVESIINTTPVSQITIFAKYEKGQELNEVLFDGVNVVRVKSIINTTHKNILFEIVKYFEYLIRIVLLLRETDVQYVNVHSLHILPIGVILKKIKKSILIYDAHELETEVAGAKGIKKKIAKGLERNLMKYVDKTILVSDSIKRWYIEEYNLKPKNTFVIRNIPIYNIDIPLQNNFFRSEFSIPEDEMIFLYQGNISKVRGCETILNLFQALEKSKHIVFMGNGDEFVDVIKKSSQIHSNIHYKEAVPYNEISKYTSSADMGLHFIRVDDVLNHKYCLPNKLFEYLLYGLPVIINSKAEEMLSIVSRFDVGFGFNTDDFDMKEAIELINELSQEKIKNYKVNLNQVIKNLNWVNEAEYYVQIYK